MIDIAVYRAEETLALAKLDDIHTRRSYISSTFDALNLPHRCDTILATRAYLSGSSFDELMKLNGGLTAKEKELVLDILERHIRFQRTVYNGMKPIVPFEQVLWALCRYNILASLNPSAEAILEIGPGVGLYPFFFDSSPTLKNFYMIEIAEAYYLLQDLQLSYVYPEDFHEHAISTREIQVLNDTSIQGPDYARLYAMPLSNKVKYHLLPWWRLNLLIEKEARFDLVITDSNIAEFNRHALGSYLYLIKNTIKKDGVWSMIGYGSPKNEAAFDAIYERLKTAGFLPVMIDLEFTPKAYWVRRDGPHVSADYHSPGSMLEEFFYDCALTEAIKEGREQREMGKLYGRDELFQELLGRAR